LVLDPGAEERDRRPVAAARVAAAQADLDGVHLGVRPMNQGRRLGPVERSKPLAVGGAHAELRRHVELRRDAGSHREPAEAAAPRAGSGTWQQSSELSVDRLREEIRAWTAGDAQPPEQAEIEVDVRPCVERLEARVEATIPSLERRGHEQA